MTKNTKGFLFIGILGLSLWGFYAATIGRTLKNLEIYFNKVGSLKYKSGNLYLYISLAIENPNQDDVTINELFFDIIQDNKKVGKVSKYNANVLVKGRTRTNLNSIEAKINLIQAASNIIKIFTNSTTVQVFNIVGHLKAGNITIPINEQIKANE